MYFSFYRLIKFYFFLLKALPSLLLCDKMIYFCR